MNALTEIIIPGIIIFVANIFSREHGSRRYEIVTAFFGWTATIFLVLGFISYVLSFIFAIYHMHAQILENIQKTTFQIFILALVTAVTRDYEKILKPKALFFEEKIKALYIVFIKKIKRN